MAAFVDYDDYLNALSQNRVADFQTGNIGRPQRLAAAWPLFSPAPATPTTSVSRDKTNDEAIGPIPNIATGGSLRMLGARINAGGNSGGALLLLDLLNASGGLDGTLTTAQTTNLPTAALTRYTNGEGVMAAIMIYGTVGATATTVTASYTNTASTSGQITTATTFGSTNFREARSFIPLPLSAGDTGVLSVESVTLAGTTGTAGNFGICLFKPLALMPLLDWNGAIVLDAVSSGGFTGALGEVDPDACLTCAFIVNAVQPFYGAINLAEV